MAMVHVSVGVGRFEKDCELKSTVYVIQCTVPLLGQNRTKRAIW